MAAFTAVATPPLQLLRVERDGRTQGSVFLVWPCWGSVIFVSQSLPALTAWLNEQGSDLRVASLYKVSRGTQRQHMGWRSEKLSRRDVDLINARIARFEDVIWFTRRPDNWEIVTGDEAASLRQAEASAAASAAAPEVAAAESPTARALP